MPGGQHARGGGGRSGGSRRRRAVSATRARPRGAVPSGGRPWWELPDEELLERRPAELGLAIEGTALEARVAQLHAEMAAKGLRFRPYFWLSSDWFTPDGATGVAIPFYLAHPRLARLERRQMLEVEGGTHDSCMRILRHEAGHAIDNAYRLHRRKRWREVFGAFSQSYRSSYTPDPNSREHVLNLEFWYSQSHPAEDYAETFAVWLDPGSRWRRRYADWPVARRKLELVDELMAEIADRPPLLRSRHRVDPLSRLRETLREYYQRRRALYDEEGSPATAAALARLFARDGRGDSAVAFLRRNRRRLVQHVSGVTGQHRYLIDHVVRDMLLRCRADRLRLVTNERDTLLDAAILLTTLTMQFLHGGHPHYHR